MVVTILLAIIFATLSALHIFWAFGYNWGLEKAVPTLPNDITQRALNPGPIPCGIVALGLAAFALFYFDKVFGWQLPFPNWLTLAIGWGVPSIFILRAIGEFNYVGLFKKVKGTPFSEMDTRYYTPFCVF